MNPLGVAAALGIAGLLGAGVVKGAKALSGRGVWSGARDILAEGLTTGAKMDRLYEAAVASGNADVAAAARKISNQVSSWKMDVDDPAIKAFESDFIEQFKDLPERDLQEINDVLAGVAPQSILTKEQRALKQRFEREYADLAHEINALRKERGQEGISPEPAEVRPTKWTGPGAARIGALKNFWDALLEQPKKGSSVAQQVADYFDKNTWFADGEVHFRGEVPGYLKDPTSEGGIRLGRVKTKEGYEAFKKLEPSNLRDWLKKSKDAANGDFEEITRKLPYLRDTHAPNVYDFASEITRLRMELASLKNLDPNILEQLNDLTRLVQGLPDSQEKRRLSALIGVTGEKAGSVNRNTVAGAVQEATGKPVDDSWKGSIARRVSGSLNALAPLGSKLALVNPATPGAVNMAQMGANTLALPLEATGRVSKAYGGTFTGDTPFSRDPFYGENPLSGGFRGGSERMSAAVSKGVLESFEKNPKFFDQAMSSDFAKRNLTNEQIQYLRNAQEAGDLGNPKAQRLLRPWTTYANEMVNGMDHPSSKPSALQGPMGKLLGQFVGTPAVSAANLITGYMKGGPWHSATNPVQNIVGITKSLATAGLVQPGLTLVTRASPLAKSLALLAAGAPIPAAILALRAYHNEKGAEQYTTAEIDAGRTLHLALERASKAKDDAEAGNYVDALANAASVAATGLSMTIPMKVDANSIIQEGMTKEDAKLGNMKRRFGGVEISNPLQYLARASPSLSVPLGVGSSLARMATTSTFMPGSLDIEAPGGRYVSLVGERAPAIFPMQRDFWIPGMEAAPKLPVKFADYSKDPINLSNPYVRGMVQDAMSKQTEMPDQSFEDLFKSFIFKKKK